MALLAAQVGSPDVRRSTSRLCADVRPRLRGWRVACEVILNLLQGLTAPKNDLGVISTDGLKDSITGTKQNDKLSYDATKFVTLARPSSEGSGRGQSASGTISSHHAVTMPS